MSENEGHKSTVKCSKQIPGSDICIFFICLIYNLHIIIKYIEAAYFFQVNGIVKNGNTLGIHLSMQFYRSFLLIVYARFGIYKILTASLSGAEGKW